MKRKFTTVLGFAIAFVFLTNELFTQETDIPVGNEGSINYWYLAGPFQQPLVGFGDPGDKEIIDELKDTNQLISDKVVNWIPKGINDNNFLDINNCFGRVVDDSPSMIWNAKASYAFAIVKSKTEQDVKLLFGGNTISKVTVNGKLLYKGNVSKNAVKDEIEKQVKLRKGENYILLKVFNTHKNYSLSFFAPVKYEWGFYFRISSADENNLSQVIKSNEVKNDFTITPTFFLKEKEGKLIRKTYVDVISNNIQPVNATLNMNFAGNNISEKLNVNYGHNFFEIFIPVTEKTETITSALTFPGDKLSKTLKIEPPKKYELHLMLLSHTDIGYTNPQPVVKEKHIKTLEEVVKQAKSDKNFKWTIETVWQLEQFRQAKPEEDFLELIDLIKSGRIAVSPLYANPFTGLISEEEAIESLSFAAELKKKYGIEYNAVVYNDVPGESQFIPQLLSSAGIYFLANGINEIYGDYQFQRNLPKVFLWEGSGSSKVINYLHESYVEGKDYGLVRGINIIENRTWEKINKLRSDDYDYDMILLNAAFTDNAGIALNQYNNALKWNEKYVYPRFVISTLSEFAEKFYEKYAAELPVIKGDFTSAWDILSQGEPGRNMKLRWIQNNITSASKLAGSLWLADDDYAFHPGLYSDVFLNTLYFTGHGSGMEYGYGNRFDNYITDAYRANYIDNAYLETEELLQRSAYVLTKPMESLTMFGVVVFNPLSFNRDEIISVEFSALENANYSAVDLTTGEKLTSYYEGSVLKFFAKDLPAMGYKKIKFINDNPVNDKENIVDGNVIENEFYKIEIDKSTCSIENIFDKHLNKSIIVPGEFKLLELSKDIFESEQNNKLNKNDDVKIEITKNALFQSVVVKNKYELVPLMELTLYNGAKSIDLQVEFDLRKLEVPEITENYNLVLPVVQKDSKVILDLLGGEFDSADRQKWIDHNSYSVRDYVRIQNNDYEVIVASPDARIFNLEKNADGSFRFIEINLANNFPLHWNRNEKNEEVLTYDFQITTSDIKKENLYAEKFSREVNSPSIVRKTWFADDSPADNFVSLSNPSVTLEIVRPIDNSIIMVLQNVSMKEQEVIINSKYFDNKTFVIQNVWGEELKTVDKTEESKLKLGFKEKEKKFIQVRRKKDLRKVN
ncbi:MAG: glycoside hydrolase family 38 C-terminal domain-containing protein [Ignavibacteria bacterium]|jgi:hypothetical protein